MILEQWLALVLALVCCMALYFVPTRAQITSMVLSATAVYGVTFVIVTALLL